MITNKLSDIYAKIVGLCDRFKRYPKPRIIFKAPAHSNILVYDSTNKEILIEILGNYDYHFFDVRGESVNLFCLLQSLFHRGTRKEAYIDIYVKHVNPKVILTFIDNSISFYKIKSRHPLIHTVFLQNGLRSYYGDVFENLDKVPSAYLPLFQVDTMLVFGDFIGKKYNEYVSGNSISVGSPKNNIAPPLNGHIKDNTTIALISQYCYEEVNISGRNYSPDEFFVKSDRFVINVLKDYLLSRNKRLIIVKRYPCENSKSMLEDDYFKSMFDERLDFVHPTSPFTSYQATDSAYVSVTIDSTLGYESLARGNRAVFFSVRSHFTGLHGYEFAWPGSFPESGFCWSNIPDKRVCFNCLDFAFTASDREWDNAIKKLDLKNIMEYDPFNNKSQGLINSLVPADGF